MNLEEQFNELGYKVRVSEDRIEVTGLTSLRLINSLVKEIQFMFEINYFHHAEPYPIDEFLDDVYDLFTSKIQYDLESAEWGTREVVLAVHRGTPDTPPKLIDYMRNAISSRILLRTGIEKVTLDDWNKMDQEERETLSATRRKGE